jgi:hypothetical protein
MNTYRYVGQEGHTMKNCASFDEYNKVRTLCKMTITTPPAEVSEKIISCQNITPSYYPNMTVEMIGKRPVYTTRNCEYNIPDIILKNHTNWVGRKFECTQPNWTNDCL